jgi:hypothetical protein
MCDMLYNRSYDRPEANVIVTTPTKLAHSNSLKAHILADCLDWLNENGYIKNLEWGYGHVQLEIITKHLQIELPADEAVTPSEYCAVGGGTENIIACPPSLDELLETVGEPMSEEHEEELLDSVKQAAKYIEDTRSEPCQEIQPEPEITSKVESKMLSEISTSPVRGRLRLRQPSTTE